MLLNISYSGMAYFFLQQMVCYVPISCLFYCYDFSVVPLIYCSLFFVAFIPEEKKSTLQDMASQRGVACRAQGWKIHLCAAQLRQLVSYLIVLHYCTVVSMLYQKIN